MSIAKTSAIRESARHVSVNGRGTSWRISTPRDVANITGPYTVLTACSYPEAMLRARRIRAQIALHLMGALDENSAYAVYTTGVQPLPVLVDTGFAAYKAAQD